MATKFKAYPEYKASGIDWLGVLPSHWTMRATHYLFDVISGSTPSPNKDYWDGSIRWITPADFNTEERFVKKGKKSLTLKGYDSCSAILVPKGSLIFSKRAPIGKVVIASEDLCTNQGCLSCVVKTYLSTVYFYYLMSILEPVYNKLGCGSTFLEISAKEFAQFKLIVPPIEEQEQIAAYLDDVTGKIAELVKEKQAQLDDIRAYRTSLITETVTRGLNPDAPLKDSGIDWLGEIPEHWVSTKAKYYIEINSGDAISKDDISEKGAHPVLGGGEVIGYSNKTNITKETIIIGRVGARCGCTHLAECNSWATDNALVVKTTQIPNYFYWLFSAANLNRLNESNAQPLITATKIKDLGIPLPPLSEQKAIADFLDAKTAKIDELIESLSKQIEELAEYKRAVITEAVTGKVDVRDWKPKA